MNAEQDKVIAFPAAEPPLETPSKEEAQPVGRPLPQAAIGYVHRPEVTANFNISLLTLVAGDLSMPSPVFNGRILDHGAPPYLNLARNALIKDFLKQFPPEVEVLLSLDADQRFRPEQAYQLLGLLDHKERPVVSGLYFAWNAEKFMPRPLILHRGKTLWDYPASELVEVDSCGMGFCAISRRWLEEWRDKHGETWFNFRGTGRSDDFAIEDRAFCERVISTGHKVHVHTGIKIGHDKMVEVNEKLFAALYLLEQRNRATPRPGKKQ